jgi:hypothetical protein
LADIRRQLPVAARRSGSRSNDIAGVGGGDQPIDVVGDIYANANGKFSNGTDSNFIFNPSAFAANSAWDVWESDRNLIRNPGDQQWTLRSSRTSWSAGRRRSSSGWRCSTSSTTPNLNGPNTDITSPNFGRRLRRWQPARHQMALRYTF